MNQSECSKIIAILQTNDRKGIVTPATIEAWALVMDDIPYAAALVAAKIWLREHSWFPFPAEFRTVLANRLTGLPPVEDAWQTVLNRMRETYPGHPAAEWDAPDAIRRAVDAMGGMHALRMSTKPTIDAERFAELYGRQRERSLREMDIPAAWSRIEQITAGDSEPTPVADTQALRVIS